MDFSSIIRQTAVIERSASIESWSFDGVPVWPLFRVALYFALRNQQLQSVNLSEGSKAEKEAVKSRWRTQLGKVFRRARSQFDIRRAVDPVRLISKCDAIFFSHSHYREARDGIYYDRHCDPIRTLLAELNWTSSIIEVAESRPPQKNVYDPATYTNEADLYHRLSSYERDLFKRVKDTSTPGYDALMRVAGEYLDAEFLKRLSLENAIDRFIRIRAKLNVFTRILTVRRPRIAFVTCWYADASMAFVWACHQLGIPTVDIQHGMQHHPGYKEWSCIPSQRKLFLPNFFWVWSEAEADAINSWAKHTNGIHRSLVGGYLWITQNPDEQSVSGSPSVSLLESRRNGRLRALLTLPTYGIVLPDKLREVVQATADKWQWTFRAHPRQVEQQALISKHFGCTIAPLPEVEAASQVSLGQLLPTIDLHITWESTVIHEAYLAGVPSIAFEPDSVEIFPAAFAAGLLRCCTLDELPENLQNPLKKISRSDLSNKMAKDARAAVRELVAVAEGKSLHSGSVE